MPEAQQYLYEVGIFTGSATTSPHTQRFNARGLVIDDGWMRFQDCDGDTVFQAQEMAVAFVRRHDKTEG